MGKGDICTQVNYSVMVNLTGEEWEVVEQQPSQ
jgi:hypothetical protein